MNSQNEKVLRYVDGAMAEKEKSLFEEELKSSPELQKQLTTFRSITGAFSIYAEPAADEYYFRNMVPGLRAKLPGRLKRFPLLRVSFITASIVVVSMFLFLLLNRSDNIENIAENLNEHQLTELINTYSSDKSASEVVSTEVSSDTSTESVVDTLYSREFNIAPESVSYYFADRRSDLTSVIQDINQEEADNIYNEMINKKLF
jgi:hypothetical protein